MTFNNKYEIDQVIGYTSRDNYRIATIVGILFTKTDILYEVDGADIGDFLEESRIKSVYIKTPIQDIIKEPNEVEIEGIAHV